MILVDTGPLVALFDPKDGQHERCRSTLETLRDPLCTTVPVLTEVFHVLSPGSHGSARLRDFVRKGGISIWFLNAQAVERLHYRPVPNRTCGFPRASFRNAAT